MDLEQRQRVLDEFDRQHGIPKGVALSAVDIPFWKLVNFFIKAYFAWLVASAVIGVFAGALFLAFVLLIGR